MTTQADSGRVILNGESLPQALELLKTGRVHPDAIAEWLVGRTDIGIGDIGAACFGPLGTKLGGADTLSFVTAGREKRASAKAAEAAAKAAKSAAPPAIDFEQFLADAKPLTLSLDGVELCQLLPYSFSSGAFGFYANCRPELVLPSGAVVKLVADQSWQVIGSKAHPRSAECAAHAKARTEAKAAARLAKAAGAVVAA